MDYFWLALILVSFVGIYIFRKERAIIYSVFKQLAPKYNGRVQSGLINYPRLTIPHEELTIHISATPGENGPFTYTIFNTDLFSGDCIFKIISKSMPTKVMETNKKLKKLKTGNQLFDQKFKSRANNEHYMRTLLTTEISESLLQLDSEYSIEARYICDKYANPKNPAGEYRFDLHVDQVLTMAEDYEKIIRTTLMFYKQMKTVLS